jgi:phosphoribosylformylglycinamidine cyclo-ligase
VATTPATYGEALLAPTTLYSPVTEALWPAGITPHYCANITGHGWRKLLRHPGRFTYRIHTVPPVPPVLAFIQQHCRPRRPARPTPRSTWARASRSSCAADAERTVRWPAPRASTPGWPAGGGRAPSSC